VPGTLSCVLVVVISAQPEDVVYRVKYWKTELQRADHERDPTDLLYVHTRHLRHAVIAFLDCYLCRIVLVFCRYQPPTDVRYR